MRHVGSPVGKVSDALGMAKGALDMARDRLHLPVFFAFDWPTPPITDDEFADLESEMERHPIGSYTMHERPPRGPCIELKATNLDDARAEAVEHRKHRTGLTDADEPPSGYAVLDLYGGCLWSYYLHKDN
jgi:hypothetical protein